MFVLCICVRVANLISTCNCNCNWNCIILQFAHSLIQATLLLILLLPLSAIRLFRVGQECRAVFVVLFGFFLCLPFCSWQFRLPVCYVSFYYIFFVAVLLLLRLPFVYLQSRNSKFNLRLNVYVDIRVFRRKKAI